MGNKFLKKLLVLFVCTQLSTLFADNSEGKFRWAADPVSNVPSAFQSPHDPEKFIGFEKEIADAIAEELGLEPELHPNNWEGLIPGLKSGLYDAVINTLCVTPARQKSIDFSEPYYVTSAYLLVNDDNNSIKTLEDCFGKNVGSLRSSKPADILDAQEEINTQLYVVEQNALTDLANGRLDAVLLDAPIAIYYSAAIPAIKYIDTPIGTLEYAVGMRKGDTERVNAVNQAIKRLGESGKLRTILDRWNLWNPKMAEYLQDFSPNTTTPVEYLNFVEPYKAAKNKSLLAKYWDYLPVLGKGAIVTLEISLASMLLATILGLGLALIRIYGPAPLQLLSKIYIEVIRGTPLLIQLYFIFYGLPSIGIKLQPFTAGTLALGLNYAAFEAENYRAGILAVHKGQMEAARALGMTHLQGLRYIVIPQAFRVMLPPVTNDFISLLKDSSLVSVITIVDLTYAYNLLATAHYSYFEIGILVAFMYLLLGLPFVLFAKWAERRLSLGRVRSKQQTIKH